MPGILSLEWRNQEQENSKKLTFYYSCNTLVYTLFIYISYHGWVWTTFLCTEFIIKKFCQAIKNILALLNAKKGL